MKKRKGRLARLIAMLADHAGRFVTLDELIEQYMARHPDEAFSDTVRKRQVAFGVWMRRVQVRLNAERTMLHRASRRGPGRKAVFFIDPEFKKQENTFLPE